jgi:hypothetical protein
MATADWRVQPGECYTNPNANSNSDCDRNADGHAYAWTDHAQGPGKKDWGNKYNASEMEGSDLG